MDQPYSWKHLVAVKANMAGALAPRITGKASGRVPDGRAAFGWAALLAALPAAIAIALLQQWSPDIVLLVGLLLFGVVFAINSSLHSYLIVSYASEDGVSLDVGFYYMANAGGRLAGTVLSGLIYQTQGITGCLWWSAGFVLTAFLLSLPLPAVPASPGSKAAVSATIG